MEQTYIVLLLFVVISAKHEYDFGLLENEPLLKQLCKEDRQLQSQLTVLNATMPGVCSPHGQTRAPSDRVPAGTPFFIIFRN